jgi:hypothetical protein
MTPCTRSREVEFGKDAAGMSLHGALGQVQILGYLGVGPAAGDEGEDLALAAGRLWAGSQPVPGVMGE